MTACVFYGPMVSTRIRFFLSRYPMMVLFIYTKGLVWRYKS